MSNKEAIEEFRKALKIADKNDKAYIELLQRAVNALRILNEQAEPQLVKFWGNREIECNADCPACGRIVVSGCIGLPDNINFCPACGQRLKWEV